MVSGRLYLKAFVCETHEDGIPRILGESERWQINIAEPDATRARQPRGIRGLSELFDVKWSDFAKGRVLRRFGSRLYFVDVAPADRPALFLNKGIESYPSLMSDRK